MQWIIILKDITLQNSQLSNNERVIKATREQSTKHADLVFIRKCHIFSFNSFTSNSGQHKEIEWVHGIRPSDSWFNT